MHTRVAILAIACSLLLLTGEAQAKSKKHAPAPQRKIASKHAPAKSKARQASRPTRAAQPARSVSRTPASRTVASMAPVSRGSEASGERVLKVRGQSRNLSMMFVLKDEKEKIRFGEVRENFREEVLKTSF